MYFKQLPCIYHPELNITNFCQDQDCLMPLCPSCIRQHTQYHEDVKTKPSYFNIYQALAQTDTLITNSILNLEKDKKRNSELIFKINRLPTVIHDKIQQAKTMAIKIVQQSFAQLEKDTLDSIAKINEDMNLHSIRKSQNLQQSLVTNLQDLYDLVEGLKTQSCLSDMIFFLKQKRFQVDDLHTEMTQYLYSNQNYEPFIEISKEAQQSLAVVIHRMFKLDPKQKTAQLQLGRNLGIDKGFLQNSYHINLTPSKVKKPLYSLQKQRTVNIAAKYGRNNQAPIVRPKNSSYQNFVQYQDHIEKSRQTSRDKNASFREGQQNSFKQINIREKQRKHYFQDINSDLRQKNTELTRRVNNTKYMNLSKY